MLRRAAPCMAGMITVDGRAKLVFLRKADKADPLFSAFRFYGVIPLLDHDRVVLPAEP